MATTQSSSDEQFNAVSEAMERRLREDPESLRQFSEGIESSLERVDPAANLDLESIDMESADFEPGDAEAIGEHLLGGPLESGENQVITAQAFWWGYQFVIPESAMEEFSNVGNVVAAFMSLGGAAIAASGGSLAPVVAIAAAYAAAELALMKAVDKGKGVYLSASWAQPALIVPTPI